MRLMKTLRIRDWDKHFENNRSRLLKTLDWVPVPNRMDGEGYTILVSHPNGAAHLGAWLAIVEIASRCTVRGTLIRDEKTLGARSLSIISRLPEAVFQEAIERLMSTEIGWIEYVEDSSESEKPPHGAGPPHDSAVIRHDTAAISHDNEINNLGRVPDSGTQVPPRARARTERNGSEGNGRETNGTSTIPVTRPAPAPEPPAVRSSSPPENQNLESRDDLHRLDKRMDRPVSPALDFRRQVLSQPRKAEMCEILHAFMSMRGTDHERTNVRIPDEAIVVKCLLTIGMTPLREVHEFLHRLFAGGKNSTGQSPRHENGPKSYAWFPTVLAREFGGKAQPPEMAGAER